MHSASQVLWASIVASTAVAAFTTLLIEYIAKPWLEARKERILDDYRQHRTAVRGLERLVGLTGQIIGLRDQHEHKLLRDRSIQYATEVERLVDFSWAELGVPRSLKEDWTKCITGVAIFAALLQDGQVPVEEAWAEVEMLARRLEQYAHLFTIRRWRLRQRYRLVYALVQSSDVDT